MSNSMNVNDAYVAWERAQGDGSTFELLLQILCAGQLQAGMLEARDTMMPERSVLVADDAELVKP